MYTELLQLGNQDYLTFCAIKFLRDVTSVMSFPFALSTTFSVLKAFSKLVNYSQLCLLLSLKIIIIIIKKLVWVTTGIYLT